MFKPSVLKPVSYVALVCCILGLLITLLAIIGLHSDFRFYLMMISWAMLLYSSYLAIKLSSYELYEEDMRKMGYLVYGIIVLFVLFMFFNLSLGILAAFYIMITLHNRKKGFDAWINEQNQQATEIMES